MRPEDDRESSAGGFGEAPPDACEELFAHYVDLLNAGGRVELSELVSRHPEVGPELIERLLAFRELRPDSANEPWGASHPLGSLGDYELLRKIGHGGMGVVYEAYEKPMERRVALKVLPTGIAGDPRKLNRFLREAKLAGQLRHPNLVSVYGMGAHENLPYYAMELVDGETLAQILARLRAAAEKGTEGEKRAVISGLTQRLSRAASGEAGSAPIAEADALERRPPPTLPRRPPESDEADLRYCLEVAEAFAGAADGLQHAHGRGIIHRDVKPANLILAADGRLRILDFGLARLEGQESFTLSDECLGTPLYMSPEQARARKTPIDHRTDIYSLGASLYEMLTWRPPFRGRDHQETLSQIIAREPLEPRKLNPRVPRDLETIVLKCLRKEPHDRYGTAEALAQDLRRFARGDPIEARPQARWEVLLRRAWRQRLKITAIAVTALLALAAALLVSAYHGRALEAKEARYRELVLRAVGSLEVGAFAEPLVRQGAQRFGVTPYPYLLGSASEEEDPTGRRARGALDELADAVKLFPRRPEAHYHRARGLWLLGRREEALAASGEALRAAPGAGAILSLRAAILAHAGEAELARREREEARRLGGAERTEPWFRAREAAAAGDWPAAAEAFGELLAREKEGASFIAAALELRLGRGLAYLRGGEPEKARIEFTRAHERWPEALAPAYLIGRSFVQEGKRELAAAWFREYQRFTSRGDAEIFRFLFDLMNRDFETLALWVWAMQPTSMRDRLLILLLVELGRYPEALEVAQRSLDERPEEAVDIALLALVKSLSAGGAKEAEKLIAQAYDKDSANIAVCALGGLISGLLGRVAERETWCRRILALDPTSMHALVILGDSLQAQGRPDEAIEVLEEASRQDSLAAAPHNILSFIHLCRRDLDAAERAARRAVELDSEEQFVLCNLGIVEHGRGRLEEADVLYRRELGYGRDLNKRPAAALVSLLEDAGRFAEAPPLMVLALRDMNNHWDSWTQNVHRSLRDALRGGAGLGIAPELDELADALEPFVAAGEKLPHLLESFALLLLHAPGRKEPERALALAREASGLRPGHQDALATLAAVHAARGELGEAIRALESVSSLDGRFRLQLDAYRESRLPAIASYASAGRALERARRRVLVPEGARWRYLVAAPEAAPAGWTERDFPDEPWSEGPSGFGYGGGDDATVLEPRRAEAVHIRHRFAAEEVHRYRKLVLSLRVDGAYAVWLNGREAASGVADAGGWFRRRPHLFVEHALDPQMLREGENLLALSARDAALWSRGLSLIPLLEAELERHRDAELELRERFAALAQSEEERRILAYLDARLLEEDGKAEEAARLYAELAAAERRHAEPHLRHAEHLLARGEARAAEEHLRRVLAGGLDAAEVWDLWVVIAFRDLAWSAGELLERLPAVESGRASDLRWLLETLEAGGAVRINCGGKEHTAASGVAWGADRFFTSGGSVRSDNNYARVAGTGEQALFQAARRFPRAAAGLPGYRLPLPRGRYRVALHFAEIDFDFQGPGRRVFDVLIEGNLALEGYDPVARAGFATAESVSLEPVPVEDGRLEIELVHRVRDPVVSAVEVERVD
jgi:serine/threonine protein kinase/Flp pilus assembly protein TadD